ncbi:uncharacterized protein NECHADRAFT_99717 [Fusarium vanettenii 77-13-4]|uniref:Uncharacterized protein n=1 Tax=Fusarium vanettenii (strain ATCC MYA-4622 / CBS 123669 / FGSC 9596 / NRRL 45880 / 77-13-4) TaxID=660122 RepID=C7YMT7_FUSV7|nr:uncharacterized protein NECHADRAFT_99717 [Fusarium vanettenii 77-13-4]EEU47009.1 hypothetical protein NECHADRAFT_99717 [Fusarium vanettenii 77-13-4]
MSQRNPMFWRAYGINELVINETRDVNGQPQTTSKEENSWTYTLVASSINLGLKILETPQGREALEDLGRHVVQGWHQLGVHQFGGNVNHMRAYVDHFLSALRQSFPNTFVADIGGPDVLAHAQRMPPSPVPGASWDGNLLAYEPKKAIGLYFNLPRVADMVGATSVIWLDRARDDQRARRERARMLNRHKDFQFMFGVSTAHELCHAFVSYLSQGSPSMLSYTPPNVSYLNYGVQYSDTNAENGESGRWFERRLFGGSLEFYRDDTDDHGQVGMLHVLDPNANAFRVNPAFIRQAVEDPTRFQFPLPVVGAGISERDRQRRGMRSLGSTYSGGPLPAGLMYMRARRVGPELSYNVSEEQLQIIPASPRPLRAQRVFLAGAGACVTTFEAMYRIQPDSLTALPLQHDLITANTQGWWNWKTLDAKMKLGFEMNCSGRVLVLKNGKLDIEIVRAQYHACELSWQR